LAKTPVVTPRTEIVLTFDVARSVSDTQLVDLVATSKVAALILYSQRQDEAYLQQRASALIHPIQAQQIAVLVAGDPRIGVRVGADGIYHEEHTPVLDTPSMMVGYGNIKDRHHAMEMGESGADYIMFGKVGADKDSAPHPRNLRLGAWWASMMQVPCIVQVGTDMAAITAVAQAGVEFIALEEMIFMADDPHTALTQVNQLLDIVSACEKPDRV